MWNVRPFECIRSGRRHGAPLTRQRVAAFIRLCLSAMVYTENAHRRGRQRPSTTKLLKKALVKRVIPFIYRRLVFTMDESMWPITLEEFRELDHYLADHLPRTHRDHPWETVAYFFKEMVQQRREGVHAGFVHPRVQGGVVDVMDLLTRGHALVQFDDIGTTPAEGVTRVERPDELQGIHVRLDIVAGFFEAGPFAFPHFHDIVP